MRFVPCLVLYPPIFPVHVCARSPLPPCRALGDPDFKHPRRLVEAEPDVARVELCPGADAFLLLGRWGRPFPEPCAAIRHSLEGGTSAGQPLHCAGLLHVPLILIDVGMCPNTPSAHSDGLFEVMSDQEAVDAAAAALASLTSRNSSEIGCPVGSPAARRNLVRCR